MTEQTRSAADGAEPARRRFLSTLSGAAMVGGLAAGYGSFAYILGRFVFPAGRAERAMFYVCPVETLSPGESIDFVTPAGARVVIARQGAGTGADDFLALSSVCPHLGCQVHWEPQHQRFFCPCHNGAFDRGGNPTEGPPKAANQALVRFPLQVLDGLLFLEAPLASVGGQAVTSSATVKPREQGVG